MVPRLDWITAPAAASAPQASIVPVEVHRRRLYSAGILACTALKAVGLLCWLLQDTTLWMSMVLMVSTARRPDRLQSSAPEDTTVWAGISTHVHLAHTGTPSASTAKNAQGNVLKAGIALSPPPSPSLSAAARPQQRTALKGLSGRCIPGKVTMLSYLR